MVSTVSELKDVDTDILEKFYSSSFELTILSVMKYSLELIIRINFQLVNQIEMIE